MLSKVVKAAAESSVAQKLLLRIGHFPAGRNFLNKLSKPAGVFDTYEQAAAAARATGAPSHEACLSVTATMATTPRLSISDYPVVHWMNLLELDELRVVDYGGGGGN